jgi:hypothetical protein
MYSKIYDFCKVRNLGNVYENDPNEPTPRVKFIISLLESEGIEYELDKSQTKGFFKGQTTLYNIILKGTSNRMIVAHHDVNNPNIDNANDNSCSVINAIMIKKLMPHIHVVLLDGEEFGGLGSKVIAQKVKDGYFGDIEWVLNLELTGKGGKYFFMGNYEGKLQDKIKSLFPDAPVVQTPFNDSVIFRQNGIDSCVINPIPPLENGEKSNVKYADKYLDFTMLYNCHNSKDTVSTIDPNDMKEFVEEVVVKILS